MRTPTVFLSAMLIAFASITQAQYSWQFVFPNMPVFSSPVELIPSNDGTDRLFVAQQRGIIYVFNNTQTANTRRVFLNISDSVSASGSEVGLLGLAFHPDYRNNGYFYLNHTFTLGAQLRSYVARYQVSSTNPDSAVKSSRMVLMVLNQPFSNHNGGKLAFGSDGYLYIGFGDGGSGNDPGNRAQNRSELLGKILRINVDSTENGNNYAIPPTNPYYRNTLGYKEEIFAYGIRNPWKFSFDPVTHELWLGDVGQDAREEISVIESGGNYGWRLMEGSICNPTLNPNCQDTAGLIRPVWDYPNAGVDACVTGGYVYRGSAIPSLYGKYIFADYSSGKTWALTNDSFVPPSAALLSDESYSISTFGVDTSNNLYLCSYSSSGRIYKLTGPSSDTPLVEGGIPKTFLLGQNYPNPFNPTTTITYGLPEATYTQLQVFDMLGKQVASLVDGQVEAGTHQVTFDAQASGLSTGVYLYRLTTPSYVGTRVMTIVK
ncbi:MAG: Glucose/sorbosone dehydrogenase [Bacteroidetes bacterium]|nr:Glucose/sorbosone dehydrogenase [Bacteroidota bacterium]